MAINWVTWNSPITTHSNQLSDTLTCTLQTSDQRYHSTAQQRNFDDNIQHTTLYTLQRSTALASACQYLSVCVCVCSSAASKQSHRPTERHTSRQTNTTTHFPGSCARKIREATPSVSIQFTSVTCNKHDRHVKMKHTYNHQSANSVFMIDSLTKSRHVTVCVERHWNVTANVHRVHHHSSSPLNRARQQHHDRLTSIHCVTSCSNRQHTALPNQLAGYLATDWQLDYTDSEPRCQQQQPSNSTPVLYRSLTRQIASLQTDWLQSVMTSDTTGTVHVHSSASTPTDRALRRAVHWWTDCTSWLTTTMIIMHRQCHQYRHHHHHHH